ncbi:MAG: Sec-independent protein translocase subunit TatA/TatB [Victivallaceae bacterium]
MSMPGMPEWIVIFIVALLFFGAKRIPEIARALGKATNEFKKAKDEITDEIHEDGEKVQPEGQESDKNKK